jgi:hypothetical protein
MVWFFSFFEFLERFFFFMGGWGSGFGVHLYPALLEDARPASLPPGNDRAKPQSPPLSSPISAASLPDLFNKLRPILIQLKFTNTGHT